MSAPTPLAFTKLVVIDLDRMVTYYRALCGFDELARVEAEIAGRPIHEVILGCDGGYAGGLILLHFDDQHEPATGETIIGFTTDDIDAFFANATGAGATVVEAPHDPGIAGVALVGFLADPEGHLAEIVQRA